MTFCTSFTGTPLEINQSRTNVRDHETAGGMAGWATASRSVANSADHSIPLASGQLARNRYEPVSTTLPNKPARTSAGRQARARNWVRCSGPPAMLTNTYRPVPETEGSSCLVGFVRYGVRSHAD
jgi:hypothetical protein